MTQHPVPAADKTEINGRDKEGSEVHVPASRKEDGASGGSNLPSVPPDTSKFEV